MHTPKFVEEFNKNTRKLLKEMEEIKTKIKPNVALSLGDLDVIQKLKFIEKLCAFN